MIVWGGGGEREGRHVRGGGGIGREGRMSSEEEQLYVLIAVAVTPVRKWRRTIDTHCALSISWFRSCSI